MTFTTDPPIVGDIDLIPGQDEKADLNAPAGSGGKLVTGQIPNISISSTSVVADAAERLALDVQEGDVAIQTNVSSSFIFTGGDNVAPNWQVLDFDAIGAISGEDISPNNITALGDISGQDIDGSSFANADLSAASNGELLGSDGSGNLQFTSPPSGGDSFISSATGINKDSYSDNPGDTNPTMHNFTDATVYNWSMRSSDVFLDFLVTAEVEFTDNTVLDVNAYSEYFSFSALKNVSEIRLNTTSQTGGAFYASDVWFEEA